MTLLLGLAQALATNVVTNSVPARYQRFALPVLIAATTGLIAIAIMVYFHGRRVPAKSESLNAHERSRLLVRVNNELHDLLWQTKSAPEPLHLKYIADPTWVSNPRLRFSEVWAECEETSIISVFDVAEQMLLIVGAAGSGKSRTLVELGIELIARAKADPTQSIPVLVSLAAYRPGMPFGEWLAEAINQRYDLPFARAHSLLVAGALVLLLDGIDESIDPAATVAAINTFQSGAEPRPLAVSSRLDIKELKESLRLRGAVLIAPLSTEQATEYLLLSGFPAPDASALMAKSGDSLLTPLTLTLAARAVSRTTGTSINTASKIDLAELWSAIIDSMIGRRRDLHPGESKARYSRGDVLRWLSWLAEVMTSHNVAQLRLDRIRVEWLPSALQARWQKRVRQDFAYGIGVMSSIYIGWFFRLIGYDWIVAIPVGVVNAAPVVLLFWDKPTEWRIRPVESVGWRRSYVSLGAMLTAVSATALAITAVVTGASKLVAIIAAMIAWSGTVLTMLSGSHGYAIPVTRTPLEGIRRAQRRALAIAGVGVTYVATISLWASTLLWELLPIALAPSFAFGGWTVLQYWRLRIWLARVGYAPLRYLAFLDYAADRHLMRRVGPAYEFLHPTQRTYLVEQWGIQPADQQPSGPNTSGARPF